MPKPLSWEQNRMEHSCGGGAIPRLNFGTFSTIPLLRSLWASKQDFQLKGEANASRKSRS